MQIRTLAGVAAVIALASCEKPAAPPAAAAPAPAPAAETAPAVPVTPPPAAEAPVPAPAPVAAPAADAPAPETPAATADAGPAGQKLVADLNVIADELNEHVASAQGKDPLTQMKESLPIIKKLDAVKGEGLPEDLASAYKGVQTVTMEFIGEIEKLPTDIPTDQAAMGEWMAKHPEMIATFQGMQEKAQAMEVAKTAFEEAGVKYGLDFSKFLTAGMPK